MTPTRQSVGPMHPNQKGAAAMLAGYGVDHVEADVPEAPVVLEI